MSVKALVLDIDGTLSLPNQPIDIEISNALLKCMNKVEIFILTAQKFEQTQYQVVSRLYGASDEQLTHLHLCQNQGTKCYEYDPGEKSWRTVYDFVLTEKQREKIKKTVEDSAKAAELWKPKDPEKSGEYFDDRGTQITFFGLGSTADISNKRKWDPDHKKRKAIVKEAMKIAPEFTYRIGGTTSIDVTVAGMDKFFGLTQLLIHNKLKESEIVYLGDETEPGGNDYPIVNSGNFLVRRVVGPAATLLYLKGFYDSKC